MLICSLSSCFPIDDVAWEEGVCPPNILAASLVADHALACALSAFLRWDVEGFPTP